MNDQKYSFCKLCLGALELCDSAEVIEFIASQVKKEGFEYEDFKFNFYSGPILTIRKCFYYTMLKIRSEEKYREDCLPSLYHKNHVDFKEVFKWINGVLVENSLGVKVNKEGEFRVNIKFQEKIREQDCLTQLSQLANSLKPIQNKRRKKRVKKGEDKKENERNQPWEPLIGMGEVKKIF